MPWLLFLFCYEEARTALIRRYPIERVLYY
jgi:hypothetical protein